MAVRIPRDHLRVPFTPRVRPRTAIEGLVDTDRHPPRRQIPTEVPEDDRLHWTTMVALVALTAFWIALPAAGLAWDFWGYRAAMMPLGLAVSSLVVSYRIEAE